MSTAEQAHGGNPAEDIFPTKVDGDLVALFSVAQASSKINTFYNNVALNAVRYIDTRTIGKGIDNLLRRGPVQRAEAYANHTGPTDDFNLNMLKAVDTIAVTLAEKEKGLTPQPKTVLLSPTSAPKPVCFMGEHRSNAQAAIEYAAEMLGIVKPGTDNPPDVKEMVKKGKVYPLRWGVDVQFGLTSKAPHEVPINYGPVPYSTITVFQAQEQSSGLRKSKKI